MEAALVAEDWQRLRKLRDRFLGDASAEYWTPRDLELYDATFAQRIGWKWDGVLQTIERAGWKPAATQLLDWGCGTGIAARAVAEWAGIRRVALQDQSQAAVRFADARLRTLGVEIFSLPHPGSVPPGTLLLLSHVAGELTDDELAALAGFAATAEEVIWVEPGSREISLRLTGVRSLLQAEGHRLIAPCTHDAACPMNGQEKDWCHFFAEPPGPIFQSAFWREFSSQLEIDLRALPYCFLACAKHRPQTWPADAERLIGHPRLRKAHCELLCCGSKGLATRTLQKRDDPGLFRRLTRGHFGGAFQWLPDARNPHRVCGGQCLDGQPGPPAG